MSKAHESKHRVAIVVSPTFGDELAELSGRVHVWACDSPRNREAASRVRAADGGHSLERGITLFKYSSSDPADQTCVDILETVDLHHGEWSHNPPWNEVEVWGTILTPVLRKALSDLGFSRFEATTDGFVAVR